MRRIAILSNVTIHFIADKLKDKVNVYVPAGFDTWQQEIFSQESGLYKHCADAVFIILYCNPYGSEWLDMKTGEDMLNTWYRALQCISEKMRNVPVFVSSLCTQNMKISSMEDIPIFDSLKCTWSQFVQELDGAYLFPIDEFAEILGSESFYSSKMWYLSSSPFSVKANKVIADGILQCLDRMAVPRKKCLAIDLDNTIWGGIIGEDTIEGIQLSNHNEGARYYDAQILLREMRRKGVMLAIISKNNLDDVEEVFQKHPYMVLDHEDFVVEIINWNEKSENLNELAKNLNIGLDAIVFLDDNPAEREEVKFRCPQVEVADFPEDTTQLPVFIKKLYEKYFKALETTKEDIQKTGQYKKNVKRQELRKKTTGLNDYLKNLEILVDIHLARDEEMKRVIQLTGKTNQFNLATTRYSMREAMDLKKSDEDDIVVAIMSDRFGDEGLVAVVFIHYADYEAYIEDFLMSCRVMGRSLEKVMIAEIVQWIKKTKASIKTLYSRYIKSQKNSPVEYLYDNLGFEMVNEDTVSDIKMYRADIQKINIEFPPYKSICAFGEEDVKNALC